MGFEGPKETAKPLVTEEVLTKDILTELSVEQMDSLAEMFPTIKKGEINMLLRIATDMATSPNAMTAPEAFQNLEKERKEILTEGHLNEKKYFVDMSGKSGSGSVERENSNKEL